MTSGTSRSHLAVAIAACLLSACSVSIPGREDFSCRAGGLCEGDRPRDAATANEDGGGEIPFDGGQPIEHDGSIEPRDADQIVDTGTRDGSFLDAAMPGDGSALDATAPRDAMPRDATTPGDGGNLDATTGDAGGCAMGEVMCAGGCRPPDECMACTTGSTCPSGQCHPILRRCIPAGRLGLCENCTTSAQCGMKEDLCVILRDSMMNIVESACGTYCATNSDCPRGYDCGATLGQCYPRPGALRTHTCAAYADMLAGKACNSQGTVDMCGSPNYDDGTCLFLFETCATGCSTLDDCPINSTCTEVVAGLAYCFAN